MDLILKNGFILNKIMWDIFEFGSNLVIILNKDCDVLYLNPPYIDVTEYEKNELYKLNFRDLITKEFAKKFESIIDVDLKEKFSWKGEIEHRKKDNSVYWTTSHFNKLINDKNEMIGYLIYEEDISSIKQLTIQLEIKANLLFEEKQKIEKILDSIPFAVIVSDQNGTIIYKNEKVSEFFKMEFNHDLLVNSALNNYLPNKVIYEILNFMKFNEDRNIVLNLDSNRHWQLDLLFLETLYKNNIYLVVISDISSLIEFDLLQRQFVTSISHELRTPIATILMSINNFTNFRQKLNEKQNENLLMIIKQNANLLKHMVEDLFIISQIDNGKLQLRIWNKIIVKKTIDQIIYNLKSSIEEKNLTIHVHCSQEVIIYGDEERLSQIFRIPIENSIKYSFEGNKILIEVEVIKEDNGDYKGIDISIQDYGIGIKKEDLKYIFKRFYRGSNVRTIQGTGIQLSILKSLLQLVKGDVSIESKEDEGTKINIFLPYLQNKP